VIGLLARCREWRSGVGLLLTGLAVLVLAEQEIRVPLADVPLFRSLVAGGFVSLACAALVTSRCGFWESRAVGRARLAVAGYPAVCVAGALAAMWAVDRDGTTVVLPVLVVWVSVGAVVGAWFGGQGAVVQSAATVAALFAIGQIPQDRLVNAQPSLGVAACFALPLVALAGLGALMDPTRRT
jgi:hypothetical protein